MKPFFESEILPSPRPRVVTTITEHSTVPKMFGWLACMGVLIVSMILILSCLYRKICAKGIEEEAENKGIDLEGGREEDASKIEEICVAVMAGDSQPRFLAIPKER